MNPTSESNPNAAPSQDEPWRPPFAVALDGFFARTPADTESMPIRLLPTGLMLGLSAALFFVYLLCLSFAETSSSQTFRLDNGSYLMTMGSPSNGVALVGLFAFLLTGLSLFVAFIFAIANVISRNILRVHQSQPDTHE